MSRVYVVDTRKQKKNETEPFCTTQSVRRRIPCMDNSDVGVSSLVES